METLNLVSEAASVACFRWETMKPHRDEQGATLPSADQTAEIQVVTSAQRGVDQQVSVCDNYARGQEQLRTRV